MTRPPARLGGLTSFGAAPRSPPVPRRPRGGLQSGGAGNDPAAREARRPHFVRRRASKPARALRSLRRPPHQWCLVCRCAARGVVSKPGRAPQASPRPLLTSLLSSPNFACNSPATLSNHEFTTLELQPFQTCSRFRPVQLHAIILGSGHVAAHRCRRSFA